LERRAMAIQSIRLFGDPGLRSATRPVETFDRELRALVADMTETMEAASGAGLAANQIGIGLRVFTYDIDGESGHLVNPVLERAGEIGEESEGCLSLPGVTATVARSMTVEARGFNMWGDPIMLAGSGFLARCLQHEVDHLDGVLFVDRLTGDERKNAMRQVRRAEWFTTEPPMVRVPPGDFGRWY